MLSVDRVNAEGCEVSRNKNSPILGKECEKRDDYFIVTTCMNTQCKAKKADVKEKRVECKEPGPSAPSFRLAEGSNINSFVKNKRDTNLQENEKRENEIQNAIGLNNSKYKVQVAGQYTLLESTVSLNEVKNDTKLKKDLENKGITQFFIKTSDFNVASLGTIKLDQIDSEIINIFADCE